MVEVYTATSARKSKAGTGVVLTRTGLVITNAHVVDGGGRWAVRVPGTGRLIPAELVGTNSARDIALLRVAERLRPARLGDSDSVAVGDTVTSVGNAYGQGRTSRGTGEVLATGARARLTDQAAASAKATSSRRPGTTLTGLIAARTNIRPGQSGGAMINQYGEVIGINVAYALTPTTSGKPARAASRVGYAIPINTALAAADGILANGAVE